MIRTQIEEALREQFPEKPFVFHSSNQPFATLEAPSSGMGRLELCDDGDEVTVYLTELTHGHFSCFDEDNPSAEEKERRIANNVMSFLTSLFADRVVVFGGSGGFAGGWQVLEEGELLPPRSKPFNYFVWSGPIG